MKAYIDEWTDDYVLKLGRFRFAVWGERNDVRRFEINPWAERTDTSRSVGMFVRVPYRRYGFSIIYRPGGWS